MVTSDDPMGAVRQYLDAFNNGDPNGMAAACADPMQILDGMPPHVWQGPTANDDWYRDVLTEGEHLGAAGTTSRSASHGTSTSLARTPTSLFPPR